MANFVRPFEKLGCWRCRFQINHFNAHCLSKYTYSRIFNMLNTARTLFEIANRHKKSTWPILLCPTVFFLLYSIYHQGCSVWERHWWVYQHVIYWLHCMFCYCRTWSNLECKSLVCSTVNWKAFTNSIVNRRSTIWTVSNGNFIFSANVSLNKHSMTNSTKYLTFLFLKKDFHLST